MKVSTFLILIITFLDSPLNSKIGHAAYTPAKSLAFEPRTLNPITTLHSHDTDVLLDTNETPTSNTINSRSSTSKPTLRHGLMVSSFANGVLNHSTPKSSSFSTSPSAHPSKLFFQLNIASILLKEHINLIQKAIESSVKFSPCAGPNIALLNLLERGDGICTRLNGLIENTFIESGMDSANNVHNRRNKSMDVIITDINDQGENSVYDDTIQEVFKFIHESSSSSSKPNSTSSSNYPPTIRILFIPTAMYALRKDSKNSAGKQRQRNRADAKKRRSQLVQFIESLYVHDCNEDSSEQSKDDRYDAMNLEVSQSWFYSKCIMNTCAVTLDFDDGSIKQPIAKTYQHTNDNNDVHFPMDGKDALTKWKPHLIYVEGGNTFWLKHCIDKGNWSQLIQDACCMTSNDISDADFASMYVGVSAGAIAAGKYVDIASWKVC